MSAQAQLSGMKSSLKSWLKYRGIVDDAVTSGKPGAGSIRDAYRDPALETRLASELYGLLSQVMDPTSLPHPGTPGAAVVLAHTAITGTVKSPVSSPSAQGLIPVALALVFMGGLVLSGIVSTIKGISDNALERERIAACKVNPDACPKPLGTYVLWGVGIYGLYWAYKNTIAGDYAKKYLGRKGR